jgi:hypothetical protein
MTRARILKNRELLEKAKFNMRHTIMGDEEEFREIGPDHLYKYRAFSNDPEQLDWVEQIITKGILYFAAPQELEDEAELKPMLTGEVKREDFLNLCIEQLQLDHESWSDQKILAAAMEFANEKFPLDPDIIKTLQDQMWERFSQFGILSLTENPTSRDMWDKYAGGNTGICIQFSRENEPSQRNICIARPVTYLPERPKISPFATPRRQSEWLDLACKSKTVSWRFEQEWRIVDPLPINQDEVPRTRQQALPEGVITGVILGPNISEKHIDMVKSWLNQVSITPKTYRAKLERGKITVPDLNDESDKFVHKVVE